MQAVAKDLFESLLALFGRSVVLEADSFCFESVSFANGRACGLIRQAVFADTSLRSFEAHLRALIVRRTRLDASIEYFGAVGFASLLTRRLWRLAALQAIGKMMFESLLAFFLRNAALQAGVANSDRLLFAGGGTVGRRRNDVAFCGYAISQGYGAQFHAMCFGVAGFEAFVKYCVCMHFASFFASRFVWFAVSGFAMFVCFEALCGTLVFWRACFDASIEDFGADGLAPLFAGRFRLAFCGYAVP